jgi:hypothetical protein
MIFPPVDAPVGHLHPRHRFFPAMTGPPSSFSRTTSEMPAKTGRAFRKVQMVFHPTVNARVNKGEALETCKPIVFGRGLSAPKGLPLEAEGHFRKEGPH